MNRPAPRRLIVTRMIFACPLLFASIVLALGPLAATAQELSLDELLLDQVLNPQRIVEISIEIPKDDWRELCKQSRDPGKVFQGVIEDPFTYFKGDITIDGVTIRSVGIRKKGFIGSLDDRFPSLKVNFSEFVKQSPIDGLDGLTLNNNKQDSSLVSQFITYQLFNAAGVEAPRSNFARVTVNGEYLGLYSHVESITKPFLQRRYGNDRGNLYEGTLADFYPKAIDRFEIKTNKKNHDRSKITQLAEMLAKKEAVDVEAVGQIVDLDNFLKFWTLESLLSFWDGYTNNQNNYWVYDDAASGKLRFMPWGADMAFMQAPFFMPFGQSQAASVYSQSMLANRLIQNKAFAEKYRETMRWQLATVWKEDELLKEIDRLESLLKPHLHPRQAGAPRAMQTTRQFIKNRRATIEKELEKWPVKVAAEPRKPMYLSEIGSLTGSFKARFNERPPQKLTEIGEVKASLTLRGAAVALKASGASVHHPPSGGFLFGFGAPPSPPASALHLVISGIRERDGRLLSMTLQLDSTSLEADVGQAVDVQGTYTGADGNQGGFMQMGGPTVTGKLTLTKAGAKEGDAIEGELDLTILEVHGGFFDQRPRGGPPTNPRP